MTYYSQLLTEGNGSLLNGLPNLFDKPSEEIRLCLFAADLCDLRDLADRMVALVRDRVEGGLSHKPHKHFIIVSDTASHKPVSRETKLSKIFLIWIPYYRQSAVEYWNLDMFDGSHVQPCVRGCLAA